MKIDKHPLTWLQTWYLSMCDGEWEHSEGLKIISSDNPGWIVRINVRDTHLEHIQIPYQLFEETEDNWYGVSINESVFLGVGDPLKLELIIRVFKDLIETKKIG